METVKKFGVWIITGMAGLGLIFIEGIFRKGDSRCALIILGVGMVLIVPFALLLWRTRNYEKREQLEEELSQAAAITRLKRMADKLKVYADDIRIREASYAELSDTLSEETEQLDRKEWSILEFDIAYKGEMRSLSQLVDRDVHTLKMKVLLANELTVYLSPFDPDEYYIDLEFMD